MPTKLHRSVNTPPPALRRAWLPGAAVLALLLQGALMAGTGGPAPAKAAHPAHPAHQAATETEATRPAAAPAEAATGPVQKGKASWYGEPFHGNPTASGERFNMHALTAAHPSLPLGTQVRVKNLANGRSVVVKVNDRGPFAGHRIIDLSYAAARQLNMVAAGTARVEVAPL